MRRPNLMWHEYAGLAVFVVILIGAILALSGCVAVQRPDGGSGLAFGVKSEVAAAAVSSFPGGDLVASILGLGATSTAGGAAYAAYLKGKSAGWDEHAEESKKA